MTKFKNTVNAFGNSPGDDMQKHVTNFGGRGSFPQGKLKRYPGEVANISTGNRRLAKAKYGTGGDSGTSFCGKNAFSRGKK
jgi:hypothetical protein